MRIHWKLGCAMAMAMALAACGGPSVPAPAKSTAAASVADPAFVGKFWITTTPGDPLGSMRIFLPDRTMLLTSCVEAYRLSKWDVTGDRIRWIEETIPIEAVFSMPRPNEFQLDIAGQERVQTYRAAPVPYVCPELKR